MKTLATLAVLACSALAGLLALVTLLYAFGGDITGGVVAAVLTVVAAGGAYAAFNWLDRSMDNNQATNSVANH